jgi:hypothetical protein
MDEHIDSFVWSTDSAGPSKPKPPARLTLRGSNQTKRKKKFDDLLDLTDCRATEPQPAAPTQAESTESVYKNKLKVYILLGKIKDLYGKIITEHELNKMSEQECENVYKICELRMSQPMSGSLVERIITGIGNFSSTFLPIKNTDKYIAELQNAYIINFELQKAVGIIAMRVKKLTALAEFGSITLDNIDFYRKTIQELDKQDEKDAKELAKELDQQLGKKN